MNLHFLRRLLPLLLCATATLPPAVLAGTQTDIDIYSGSSAVIDRPNVLLILDSSANWSTSIPGVANCRYKDNGVDRSDGPVDQGTKLAIEQCALHNVIDGLPVDTSKTPNDDARFNVAIMLMNESPHNGGYPRQAFLPVTTVNKAILKARIRALHRTDDNGSNADYGQALYEAYLYYKGMAPLNGTVGSKEDSAAFSGGLYRSPSAGSCGRNYIILIGNGSPQNTSPENAVQGLMSARIDADLPSFSVAERNKLRTKIPNPALGNDEKSWSDEMSRFMSRIDVSGMDGVQGITTHAVAVKKGPSDGDFPALMQSIASESGGLFYEATTTEVLIKAINDIFNQIQAVNSVFASASLPVSVNARGTYLNQVYMGMFRPDADGHPRWRGNLKQYRFALDGINNLYLADAAGGAAVSSSTGFISPDAVSFWTTPSTFWAAKPLGTPPSDSDSPDGEVVEKGAVAQRLRTVYATSQGARKVYTCIGCANGAELSTAGVTSTKFDTTNTAITNGLLGVATDAERSSLINWLRGENNVGDEVITGAVRPSVHADVLHSRPAVVNYGGSTGVVVFYGSNDGQLRAVNGNQTGNEAGNELWSFVPEEHFGKLNRLRTNVPKIELSTTVSGTGATPRDYFVDGPIGVYQKLQGTSVSQVIIYVGMRRGGRQLYALDVTVPTAPKFLWKVTNGTSGMSALGQTWSEPKVARVKGHDKPVVIFGGGYDASAEDGSAGTTMGNAVYVLDALDGSVLKVFQSLSSSGAGATINRSVAADVSLVDTDYDGKVDRAYAVDLGGQVYRIDFEGTATNHPPSSWTIFKLADLSAGTSSRRKFFYGPDVVHMKTMTALMFGSGDREKPLQANTQDHFFQIFDRHAVKGAPASVTPIVFTSLLPASQVSSIAGDGCYMALAQGEKVVNAATSIAGYSYFGTNRPVSSTPSGQSCTAVLGEAKSYAMPLFCVASGGTILAGGGLPPSPVAGIVTVTDKNGKEVQVPFVIGAPNPKKSGIEGIRVNPTIKVPRKRRYWYSEGAR